MKLVEDRLSQFLPQMLSALWCHAPCSGLYPIEAADVVESATGQRVLHALTRYAIGRIKELSTCMRPWLAP